MEKPWEKFLNTVGQKKLDEILNLYYHLRNLFQENNVKNYQLEKGEGLTREMYVTRDRIINRTIELNGVLRKYGLIENPKEEKEYSDYLVSFFRNIDLETPLQD